MTRPTHGWQRGLQHFNGCIYLPNSVDGTGGWDPWDPGTAATITHATVGSAYDTQLKRTIWTNTAVANQELGPKKANAGDRQFFLGNAAYCGGFYFSAIFRIENWFDDTGNIFIGLTNSLASVAVADAAIPANSIGLSHISTDGADVLKLRVSSNAAVVDATTDVTTHAANPGILAANATFLWEMWAFPNGIGNANTNFKLSLFDVANDSHGNPFNRVKKVKWGTAGQFSMSLTAMMAPQCQMSNIANNVAGRFGMSVANVYCVPHSGEMD